jgi:hypothetical protein
MEVNLCLNSGQQSCNALDCFYSSYFFSRSLFCIATYHEIQTWPQVTV